MSIYLYLDSSESPCGSATSTLFEAFHILLNLFERGAAFALEILELLDDLTQHSLFKQVVNELVMILRGVESGENLH